MDDLIADLAEKTGLEPDAVRSALGRIIAFLEREDRSRQVSAMIDRLDGARALAAGRSASGGLFVLFAQLSGAGLGLDEIKAVATGFLAFAKSQLGVEEVDQTLRSIPSLSQFL
jgi:hypothetical protein